MNNKYRHFKTACLASVAVLLGACSSTPDMESNDAGLQASMKHVSADKLATGTDNVVPRTQVMAKKTAAATKTRQSHSKQAMAKRNTSSPPKAYVPPKPIVVAVHKAKPKMASRTVQHMAQAPRTVVRKKIATQYKQPVQVASIDRASLTQPSLPRATAAVVAGAPVIRPATVPRSLLKRSVYVAPNTVNAQQQRAEQARLKQARDQQRARAQWQQEQKALAYRKKWEQDQQAKAQQQQARVRQAQIQQAKARQQQIRAQQARLQLAKQQQAQQQARLQAASFKQPNRTVLRRPATQYAQNRLTGDFAGNPQAEAFIRMMVARHGFSPAYVTGVLSRAEATPWLRKQAYRDANPTKRTKKSKGPSWSNYRRRFITSRHINSGTAFYNRYRSTLQRAAAQYGVPEEYILGIMGVETIYGGNVGTDRAIDALATMSFMNARRGRYFTSELESYFLMTRRAGLDPLQPKASYAGALGLPQFMPSNIKKYGVDYDGDGAVNLWTPHDAIGSIANYLRGHGWRPGEIAAIPAVKNGAKGYSRLKNGFKHKHSLAKLARNGLQPAYPGVSGRVNMVKLRTHRGNEYWIGGNNFYVITRYNHSSHYAMAVHQLAQEIRKRVKPRGSNLPRVIEASTDQNLLMQAASTLL